MSVRFHAGSRMNFTARIQGMPDDSANNFSSERANQGTSHDQDKNRSNNNQNNPNNQNNKR
jgi:hypothetical protein